MADCPQKERVIQYAKDRFGTDAEYLWSDIPGAAVFRHSASKKWYGLIMGVPSAKLGLPGDDSVDVLDVKCNTIMIGSLLSEKGFLPAYHMNKNHWLSILLNDSVPDDQIFSLLELSYDSVAPKRRRRNSQPAEE